MKIKNLRQDGREWHWEIQENIDNRYSKCEFPNSVSYSTDERGEGLFKEFHDGWDPMWNCPATRMRQILGTSQFSMTGCRTYSGAYSKIKRFFRKETI